jgi:hypothetical protein
MTGHQVVVFSSVIPSDPEAEERTGKTSPPIPAHVAVCRECPWRGEIWGVAQRAVDEANRHRHATAT